ncbi:NB-ARC domain-containing protein [Catenulispora subtropica]|uniref:NB-ARC domain-containing protein n=1 Tax=Catenulispora subtropica TaxID=450798 RepID=A0ABP5CRJ4_9ACTN
MDAAGVRFRLLGSVEEWAAGQRVAVPVPTPHQLPTAPRWFVGRAREAARLTALLDEQGTDRPGGSSGTPMICAIGGVGGIGKTWLALEWAHRNLDRFPDGQLYVDLRGFDPAGQPMSAQTALRGFLAALGVAPADVPTTADGRVGLYRSLLAGRRMLLLLDDVRDPGQVESLLPGSAKSTVLLTSRQHLPSLLVKYGAVPLELGALTSAEAHALFACHLGEERTAAEADAVAELAKRCAGLPLAVSGVAARALTQPAVPLAVLADGIGIPATTSLSTPAPSPSLPLSPSRLHPALCDPQEARLVQRYASGRYRMPDPARLLSAPAAAEPLLADDLLADDLAAWRT